MRNGASMAGIASVQPAEPTFRSCVTLKSTALGTSARIAAAQLRQRCGKADFSLWTGGGEAPRAEGSYAQSEAEND